MVVHYAITNHCFYTCFCVNLKKEAQQDQGSKAEELLKNLEERLLHQRNAVQVKISFFYFTYNTKIL